MKKMVATYLIAFILTATGGAGYASGFARPQAEAGSLISNGLVMPMSNCGIINLEEYAGHPGTNPDHQSCAYACAHSNTVVFVPQTFGTQYNWSVSGGTFIP